MPRHTEAERRKNRFTGGTNRVQTADLGSQPLTRVGASGGGKNLTTQRAIQTGGAGDGVKRAVLTGVKEAVDPFVKAGRGIDRARRGSRFPDLGGRSTTGRGATGIDPDVRKRFIESPGFFAGDQPTKPTAQIIAERERTETGRVVGVEPPKPVKIGGTTRLAKEDVSIGGRGSFTDIGEFKKGGKTLRELAGAKRGADIFSEKGISELFGSAADLAKLFTSKEFQQRKALGIQSAAGVKGRRADTKAKTERIKALSGVLEDLSLSGGDNEGLMARIQEQIQSLISGDGGGASSEVIGKLAGQFDDDQIKTILGIIR